MPVFDYLSKPESYTLGNLIKERRTANAKEELRLYTTSIVSRLPMRKG